jgi:hypothetical protein
LYIVGITMTPALPFYETIHQLRKKEIIVLYSDIPAISERDERLVKDFLEVEYSRENIEYPFTPPPFDASAAIWAAKIVYTAAQLLLYRKDESHNLPALLPAYKKEVDAASMLSVDLVLRFVPEILHKAIDMDKEDALVPILQSHLQTWHYSGILFEVSAKLPAYPDTAKQKEIQDAAAYSTFPENQCFRQLYFDRIIKIKHTGLAEQPSVNQQIKAALGNHYTTFWKP